MITVIGNLKGGTGKSTLVINLALWLAYQGRSVTLHDLDPQGTLTDTVDVRREEGHEPALVVSTRLPARSRAECLVDVGTSDMTALVKALGRADRIIMPVTPSQADVWSTQRFLDIIEEATGRKKKKPELMVFLNRADTHHLTRENDEAMEALGQLDNIRLLKSRLSHRIDFRRSFSEGLSVFELNPSGKAAAEIEALAREIHDNDKPANKAGKSKKKKKH